VYLEAVSLGYAVPRRDFVACIHSVFRTSVNLQLEGENGLLTLTNSCQTDLPQGIRLEAPEESYFKNLSLGHPVYCRDGILSFQKALLQVDLRKARRWRCNLTALNTNMTDPAVALAWSRVWAKLNKRQIHAKADIVAEELLRSNKKAMVTTARKASQAMRRLVRAARNFDLAAVPAAGELIGLGAGLTPSGDDLLVGYLTGLWCTVREKIDRHSFVSRLGQAIIDFSRETNDISRTYLFHAAQGQVAGHLAALAQAISQGEDQNRLLGTAEAAMQDGHTSGMDAVTGLLLGLTTWSHPSTPALTNSPIQV
jgi:hypothetical protein